MTWQIDLSAPVCSIILLQTIQSRAWMTLTPAKRHMQQGSWLMSVSSMLALVYFAAALYCTHAAHHLTQVQACSKDTLISMVGDEQGGKEDAVQAAQLVGPLLQAFQSAAVYRRACTWAVAMHLWYNHHALMHSSCMLSI